MYTRLNHLGVTTSYKHTLNVVDKLSKHHDVPINKWLSEGSTFKFVGDNVDRKKVARDVRGDHHGQLMHMFSLIAVKDRVAPPSFSGSFLGNRLSTPPTLASLITIDEVTAMKQNLTVLVSRVLCQYIKCLSHCSSSVAWHIEHIYSKEMASKSDVAVLDVLHLNEAQNSDLYEIMKITEYLGPEYSDIVLCGGDQMTTERQACIL